MIIGGLIRSCFFVLKLLSKHKVKAAEKHLIHNIPENSKLCSRVIFVYDSCKDNNVLHFGFADAPFTEEKIKKNSLLHFKIKEISKSVVGIDYDSKAIEIYKKLTGDNNVLHGSIYELKNINYDYTQFDTFLLAETLEHLGNPQLALETIRKVMPDSAKLVITVPNALNLWGFYNSLHNFEGVHSDHVAYYSPATLVHLLELSGFDCKILNFYTSYNEESVDKFFENRKLFTDGLVGVFTKR